MITLIGNDFNSNSELQITIRRKKCDLTLSKKGAENTQGLAVIFSHHQYVLKEEREGTFFAAESESRLSTPFFASKTV